MSGERPDVPADMSAATGGPGLPDTSVTPREPAPSSLSAATGEPAPKRLSPAPRVPVPGSMSPAPGAPVSRHMSLAPGTSAPPGTSPGTAAPRIVDLVFTPARPARSRRLPAALVAALAHLGLAVWVVGMQPSLEAWSADLAARIHDELTRVEIVDITPPEPPPPAEPPPPVAAPPAPPTSDEPALPPPDPPAPRARIKVGVAPAQAGKIVSAPKGALDLTGDVFVEGQGSAYAGGATSPGGTGKQPVASAGTPPPPPPRAEPPPAPTPKRPSRAAPVSLRSEQWSCPWPAEAADLPLDEQTATIRVMVRADGSVESSVSVEDPGDGFAAAALRCARATRFTPATDADGRPIRALSPPIRVHFYR